MLFCSRSCQTPYIPGGPDAPINRNGMVKIKVIFSCSQVTLSSVLTALPGKVLTAIDCVLKFPALMTVVADANTASSSFTSSAEHLAQRTQLGQGADVYPKAVDLSIYFEFDLEFIITRLVIQSVHLTIDDS